MDLNNTGTNPFDALAENARNRIEYWVEGAAIELTENIVREMEKQGVNRATLADRIGAKAPYITRVLRGDHNFTLRKMVEIARALKCELRLHLQPDGAMTSWHDYVSEQPTTPASFINTRTPSFKCPIIPMKFAEGSDSLIIPTIQVHDTAPTAA
jgi:transcriptional regulator with XRE-family HTH domain